MALLLVLPACTGSPGADSEPGAASPPSTSGTASSGPRSSQPLVLAAPAAGPRVRLGVREARRVLAGRGDRWQVVAAPGAANRVGDAVPIASSLPRALSRAADDTLVALPASRVGPAVRPALVGGHDPLREPRRYPLQVSGPGPGTVTELSLVGDLMLTRGVADPAAALAPLAPRLRAADLTVGTLESTLSDSGVAQQGSDSFAAPPAVVPLLEGAGLDALSLANNHVGDYQQAALLETVRRLRGSTMVPFGAGADRAAAARPAVLEVGGVRFGFLGFNAIGETPQATRTGAGALSVRMPPRTGPLRQEDLRFVERRVRRLSRRVDVVVVLPHWGTQYTHGAEPIQRRVARRLAAAGADLVSGGHPHWVQGMELVGDTLVAHSLGNFVFDMDFMVETQQGVILETVWWEDELKGFDLVPYRMDARFAPRRARGAEAREILGDVWRNGYGALAAR